MLILSQACRQGVPELCHAQFTCFTSTQVQILTQQLRAGKARLLYQDADGDTIAIEKEHELQAAVTYLTNSKLPLKFFVEKTQ